MMWRLTDDLRYIAQRIEYRWLTASPLIVVLVLILGMHWVEHDAPIKGSVAFAALIYFVLGSWPQRWVLSIVVSFAGLTELIGRLAESYQFISQWMAR